jgi:WD40 repeat protein
MGNEIKSVQVTSDAKQVLVGTYGGEIWELSTKDVTLHNDIIFKVKVTKYQNIRSIVKSHYNSSKKSSSEIWGLAFSPAEPDLYYTCGDDASLRIWSLS